MLFLDKMKKYYKNIDFKMMDKLIKEKVRKLRGIN